MYWIRELNLLSEWSKTFRGIAKIFAKLKQIPVGTGRWKKKTYNGFLKGLSLDFRSFKTLICRLIQKNGTIACFWIENSCFILTYVYNSKYFLSDSCWAPREVVLNWGQFWPQSLSILPLKDIWKYFWLSQEEMGSIGIYWVEVRDATKHLSQGSPQNSYLALKVNSVEVKKPCPRPCRILKV